MTPTDWYAPNQQAVRADGSGPAETGQGGSTPDTEQDTLDEGAAAVERSLEQAEPAPHRARRVAPNE